MDNLEKIIGVGKATLGKLRKAGYNTIKAIAEEKPELLVKKIGIFPSVAIRIVDSAKKITEARIKEEEEISESGIKRKEEEEIEEKEDKVEKEEREDEEEIEEREEGEKEEIVEKKAFEEKQNGKIPLGEILIPVIVGVLKKDGNLFKEVVEQTAEEAAKYIKESAEFKGKILNAAMENKNFRQRLVNRIAKNLCD